jgi:hypothetical protein
VFFTFSIKKKKWVGLQYKSSFGLFLRAFNKQGGTGSLVACGF